MNNLTAPFDFKSASFISVRGYTNEQGEKSNYVILINFDREKLVNKDIEKLKAFAPQTDIEEVAKQKLLASLINNQNKETASNQSIAQSEGYIHLSKAVREKVDTGDLYIMGIRISKEVLIPGNYKETNQRELTKVQDRIKKDLDLKYWTIRQFKIAKEFSAKVKGETIEFSKPE